MSEDWSAESNTRVERRSSRLRLAAVCTSLGLALLGAWHALDSDQRERVRPRALGEVAFLFDVTPTQRDAHASARSKPMYQSRPSSTDREMLKGAESAQRSVIQAQRRPEHKRRPEHNVSTSLDNRLPTIPEKPLPITKHKTHVSAVSAEREHDTRSRLPSAGSGSRAVRSQFRSESRSESNPKSKPELTAKPESKAKVKPSVPSESKAPARTKRPIKSSRDTKSPRASRAQKTAIKPKIINAPKLTQPHKSEELKVESNSTAWVNARFTLQVRAFRSEKDSERFLRELDKRWPRLPTRILVGSSRDRPIYRVFLGAFKTRGAALKVRREFTQRYGAQDKPFIKPLR